VIPHGKTDEFPALSMQVEDVETQPTARAPVSEKPLRKQTTTEREAVSDGHVPLSRSYEETTACDLVVTLSLNGTISLSLNRVVDII
jgi:hypothetical protein